jgi:uncharacterized protein YcaQ
MAARTIKNALGEVRVHSTLSLPEARRLALASQGFSQRPQRVTVAHIEKLATQIHAFQIDSANVLAHAHSVPAFAPRGPARRTLDTMLRVPNAQLPPLREARQVAAPFVVRYIRASIHQE